MAPNVSFSILKCDRCGTTINKDLHLWAKIDYKVLPYESEIVSKTFCYSCYCDVLDTMRPLPFKKEENQNDSL